MMERREFLGGLAGAMTGGLGLMAISSQAFEAAKSFSNVTKEELATILEKTKPVASEGNVRAIQDLANLRLDRSTSRMARR